MRASALVVLTSLVACGSRDPSPTTPLEPSIPPTEAAPTPPAPPPGPPPVTIADTPPVIGDIGTSGYAWVMAAAPGGEWVLACQARKDTDKDGKIGVSFGHHGELFGDDPEPYLIRGAGAGESLGEVAGVDPARRYIVVVRGNTMELLDVATNQRVALRDADTRYESGLFGGARVAFDAEGKHLLYARPGAKRKLVVRTLATGTERELVASRGDLRGAEIADGWIVAHVLYTPPGALATASSGRSGPPHTVGGRRCRPDDPLPPNVNERHYAPLAGGDAKPRADAIVPLGPDLIVRAVDGALALEQGGTLVPIAPAACKGRVIERSAEHRSVLVACEGSGDPAELWLWHLGTKRVLDVKIANPAADQTASDVARAEYSVVEHPGRSARFAQISTGTEGVLVDLESGKSRKLGDFYVVASHDTRVLLHRREGAFAIYDLVNGHWHQLPGTPPDSMIEAQRGRLFAAGPRVAGETPGVLVDLDAWTVLGTFAAPALAVSTTGWVLQPSPLPAGAAGLSAHAHGPLRWVRPKR